jgi:hypothetical protein
MYKLKERLRKSFLEYDVIYFSITIEESRVLNKLIKLRYDKTEESGFHAGLNGGKSTDWDTEIEKSITDHRIAENVFVFFITQGGTTNIYTKCDFDKHNKNVMNYMMCKKEKKYNFLKSFDSSSNDQFIALKTN